MGETSFKKTLLGEARTVSWRKANPYPLSWSLSGEETIISIYTMHS